MSTTLTTLLTASSGNFNTFRSNIDLYKDTHNQLLDMVSRVTRTILVPAYNATVEYVKGRQSYLNSQLASNSNLNWRSPLTNGGSLCAFHGGANSIIKEGGTFANMEDWTSSDNFSNVMDWTVELFSTVALSANRIDLPSYQEITIPGITHYQGSYEAFNTTLVPTVRSRGNPSPQVYIDQAGLGGKYTVQDFINFKEDWEFGMEWINSNPREAGNNIPGLKFEAENMLTGIDSLKPLTAFEEKKMNVSSRHNL